MSHSDWVVSMKPAFLAELSALPKPEVALVHQKLGLLAQDPTPDGKLKKRLQNYDGKVCRLRAGDTRVFYTLDKPYISLLAVRWRKEAYDDAVDAEFLGGPDDAAFDLGAMLARPTSTRGEPARTKLPKPVTAELLLGLHVDSSFHRALVGLSTEEDLLNCPGVPDEVLLSIHQSLVERTYAEVVRQPDLVAQGVDDILRWSEGDLLGFLLKLDDEQKKFISWRLDAGGPTLLKGGPGTGKSTVALYRCGAMLAALQKAGVAKPRILFTTYTRALTRFSEQLLEQLLGERAKFVEVRTADGVARGLLGDAVRIEDDRRVLRAVLATALKKTELPGNTLQKKAAQLALERLGLDYLLDELCKVIVGRDVTTCEGYLTEKRPGRKAALSKSQREAVWRVGVTFHEALAQAGKLTWEQMRALAAERAASTPESQRYDGVIVDEAQDLDPVALRMLVRLCKAPDRLFLTADANQSIYGAGFRWSDVHDSLRFQGRTGLLRSNFRSTREVDEAASSYLGAGAMDAAEGTSYAHTGAMPAVRAVKTHGDQAKLLERFYRGAMRELRHGLSGCALLVPSETVGRALVDALHGRDVPAQYMSGSALDLQAKAVKVLTLKSAKGLEFPIVALAGFLDEGWPWLPVEASEEEVQEVLERERRTLFVAMTRAMRALLVITPHQPGTPLLSGWDARKWNLG